MAGHSTAWKCGFVGIAMYVCSVCLCVCVFNDTSAITKTASLLPVTYYCRILQLALEHSCHTVLIVYFLTASSCHHLRRFPIFSRCTTVLLIVGINSSTTVDGSQSKVGEFTERRSCCQSGALWGRPVESLTEERPHGRQQSISSTVTQMPWIALETPIWVSNSFYTIITSTLSQRERSHRRQPFGNQQSRSSPF